MSIKIAASVLSADFSHLADEIKLLEAADMIHLDLMDGHYVPNLSFGYPLVSAIRKLSIKPLDAHLMVTNPQSYIEPLADIGIEWISFHQETVYHSHRMIQKIKSLGIKAGIALNPATPINSLDAILEDLDYVLLMSVNPGYSSQRFIPSVIDKVRQLSAYKKQYPQLQIEVDGGVNADNCTQLIEAGANILVSASYIFDAQDYSQAIYKLRGK
ncbi:MAG: ribulose-phosphate 3-epimerase [Candidatus Cloacimonetes bacterium]|jgi:ribulose-phosphate 3-epimerase|nr:ribulose-phosphate 3-epimerase [Candidatus Cloacimonadota bacterium]MDY0298910.1 ribulose-phosphate 3-epimerase [Candidatus Cloacimonadaceae bacterium]MCB5278526.1 ribulose-phosphate 3-epimerase [Candidatus Cloacimonadota bacterium]MCK9331590.1 ribulose-phosphate 3-epimerase [Candidatus Cloacimonadota bacterium]MDD2210498.1 ribulose-phosphate 3-epimerase [Candidatus Cloacimonadota bacterium]